MRIASQHSQRRLSQRRSQGAASMRRPTFTAFGDPNSPVFEEDDDGKLPNMEVKKMEIEGPVVVLEKDGPEGDGDNCEKCRGAEEEEEGHAYPDGGYGWVVVACCTTLCALTNGWGMNFGVFQQYYVENVYPTAPTAVISLAGTTQGFVSRRFVRLMMLTTVLRMCCLHFRPSRRPLRFQACPLLCRLHVLAWHLLCRLRKPPLGRDSDPGRHHRHWRRHRCSALHESALAVVPPSPRSRLRNHDGRRRSRWRHLNAHHSQAPPLGRTA